MRRTAATRPSDHDPAAGGPAPSRSAGDGTAAGGGRPWRLRTRTLLVLVVLLPLASTGVLVVADGTGAWRYQQRAQVVAADASRLQVVAGARAELNALEVPLSAVSYAAEAGVSESVLDSLLKPTVPYRVQLAHSAAAVAAVPTFSSTPTLRADRARLDSLIAEVEAKTVTYPTVHSFLTAMAGAVDDVWYEDFNRLQNDVSAWQPPGSFEVHTAALRQTYAAFLAGGREIEGGIFVLEGIGPSDAKQELIQAAGNFESATGQFQGHLGPEATTAWARMVHSAADRHFEATLHQGLAVALNDLPAPFLDNLQFAGSSERPALQYLSDLDALVVSASNDLRSSALAQAGAARGHLVDEGVLLLVLMVLSVGGVIVASRVLTGPLTRLATLARRAHEGEFDLESLPEHGPREVVATTAAFNDMASTLKAVEAKTVALATEDLSHPELLVPLPGRTGRALQASVDTLATRIREREIQRQLLHDAATHDRLTGLLNRAAVLDFLTNDVSRRREAGETVAVLFIDLDRLKPLNDTYGHEAGDNAILVTAQALADATADCDVVGRLGGDEFLVVLCHEHSTEGEAVAARIRGTIGGHSIPVQDVLVPLEASVGIALARCDSATDPMRLVREADEAMYEAKKLARALRDQAAAGAGGEHR